MAPQSKRVLRTRTLAQARAPTLDVQILETSCVHECTYGELWKSREFLDKQTPDTLCKSLRVMLCYARNAEDRSNVLKDQIAEKQAERANGLVQHRRVGLEPNIEQNGTLIREFPELAQDILQEVTARSVQVLNNEDGILVVTIDPAEVLAMTIKHAMTMYEAGKHGEYQAGFNAGFAAAAAGAPNPNQAPAAAAPILPPAAVEPPAPVAQEAPPTATTRVTRASTAKKRPPPIDLTDDADDTAAPEAAEADPSRPRKRVRIEEPAADAPPPAPKPPAEKAKAPKKPAEKAKAAPKKSEDKAKAAPKTPAEKAKAASKTAEGKKAKALMTPEERIKAAEAYEVHAKKKAHKWARKVRTAGYTLMREHDWATACAMDIEGVKAALGEACTTHRRCEGESVELRRQLAEMEEGE